MQSYLNLESLFQLKKEKILSKKQNNEISDEMKKEKQIFEILYNRQFDLLNEKSSI